MECGIVGYEIILQFCKKEMQNKTLISQLRETENETEEQLEQLKSRLEQKKNNLHLEWDKREDKMRDDAKIKKSKLNEELTQEFEHIRRKASEKRKTVITELENRANSRIREASHFLIEKIIR